MNIGPDMLALLKQARDLGASDLLLAAGSPPSVYVHARLQALPGQPLTPAGARALIDQMLDEKLTRHLEQCRDVDFSLGHPQIGRCRVNAHYQRNTVAAAVRLVNDEIPDFAGLNLPDIMREFAGWPRGLVLITGGTGSGKSTTLAAILNQINHHAAAHIITLEDPIEYAFKNVRSVIEQREIGSDSPSFADALRHVVRQKPDVIMIGEMRDLETIRTAITAAETGHLVLASLHTINAAQTIERIIDVFEPNQQPQVRLQMAGALRAIACQTLLASADGSSVVPAVEILMNTPAISRAIRDGETHLITGMIETGANRGMQTLDAAIFTLLQQQRITREDALAKALDPERLERMLERGRGKTLAAAGPGSKPWE
ncbi:MAG TPA: PilT/PilU family type 4a pilus ATPase [Phycisphaerae bacterium]|nr:PilT/PilU family type 4a pilus ATPase [Phycisphaerae bacterium]HNU46636.1 PilT/PilU family type 4a pilus ATPase [Phycisphaerae bacterium]